MFRPMVLQLFHGCSIVLAINHSIKCFVLVISSRAFSPSFSLLSLSLSLSLSSLSLLPFLSLPLSLSFSFSLSSHTLFHLTSLSLCVSLSPPPPSRSLFHFLSLSFSLSLTCTLFLVLLSVVLASESHNPSQHTCELIVLVYAQVGIYEVLQPP